MPDRAVQFASFCAERRSCIWRWIRWVACLGAMRLRDPHHERIPSDVDVVPGRPRCEYGLSDVQEWTVAAGICTPIPSPSPACNRAPSRAGTAREFGGSHVQEWTVAAGICTPIPSPSPACNRAPSRAGTAREFGGSHVQGWTVAAGIPIQEDQPLRTGIHRGGTRLPPNQGPRSPGTRRNSPGRGDR
jgi:hypothetical protein